MASGAGVIKNEFLKLATSFVQSIKRLLSRMLGESGGQLIVSLDGESRSLLAGFAEQGHMTVEEAAASFRAISSRP